MPTQGFGGALKKTYDHREKFDHSAVNKESTYRKRYSNHLQFFLFAMQ
jgi:hypothetical protein